MRKVGASKVRHLARSFGWFLVGGRGFVGVCVGEKGWCFLIRWNSIEHRRIVVMLGSFLVPLLAHDFWE